MLEAMNFAGEVLYRGDAHLDLDGTPKTVEIGLYETALVFTLSEYFPLGQGDIWTYRDIHGDYDSLTIGGTEIINGVAGVKVIKNSGTYNLKTIDNSGLKELKEYDIDEDGWNIKIYNPPKHYLPAKLHVGQSHSYTSTVHYADNSGISKTGTETGTFTVVGIEDVTVPAGTFKDCLKIHTVINFSFSDGSYLDEDIGTSWLAKGVGIVKQSGTSTENTGGVVEVGTWDDVLVSATIGGVKYYALVIPALIGTWGYFNIDHTNGGGWESSIGTFTLNPDGTGIHTRTENDSEEGVRTLTDNFTFSALQNSNGTILMIVVTAEETNENTIVLSDNGNMLLFDGTEDIDDQEMTVAIKLNTSKIYTNADLTGDGYGMLYVHDPNRTYLPGGYVSMSSIRSFDGAGGSPFTITWNADGIVGSESFAGTYSLSSDGRISFTGGAPIIGYYGGNENLILGSYPVVANYYEIAVGMRKGDRVYSTADLAGTWALIQFGDISGVIFNSAFGAMNCNSTGSCAYSVKSQNNGIILNSSGTLNVSSLSADGSLEGSIVPDVPFLFTGAIGNGGNTIVGNRSFDGAFLDRRYIVIGIRCSACYNMAGF
ncbi:MAG: hypothetical protein AB1442_10910 [Nitrospirota bacterium]